MDDHLHIVCPLSGVAAHERAIPFAVAAAAMFGADVTLFSAVEDRHEVSAHEAYLQQQAAMARLAVPQLHIDIAVAVNPHPPEAIAELIVDDTLAVISTSTQPFAHDGYVGSAAEHLIRTTGRPALLVGRKVHDATLPREPATPGDLWRPARIIVPIDGSETAAAALPVADHWAGELGIGQWLIHVATDDERSADEELAVVEPLAAEIGASSEVLHHPDPAVALAAAAGTDSLIVMSTHGRSGLRRIALGSVAAETVRRALAPVLVVPAPVSR